jgi:hypothetical protein
MKPESSGSRKLLGRDELLVLGAAAILSGAIYLFASALIFRPGFPLDDSWIHQTYARNLALQGEWSFRPGVLSAGSTSPLWSALLVPGFWVGLAPLAWGYLLGVLALFGLTAVSEAGVRRAVGGYHPRVPWVGIFMAFEWHMAWAAMSGMETLVHALLVTAVLVGLLAKPRNYLLLGWLTGLSVWVRPDGLTLLGPVTLVALLEGRDAASRFRSLERYLLGFGALFLPYLLFNLWTGGRPMPNTFYAKQAEYVAWQASPLIEKAAQLGLQLLTGPAVILAPGAITWLIRRIRQGEWEILAPAAWFGGYIWLYASRLPLYQHGRYVMPAMPIFFLLGWLGLLELWRSGWLGRYHWFGQTLWQASLLLVTVLFVILGARSYGEDVAVIESEMVATAKWAHSNLPKGALIAAHDIGALGFFDGHPLIDLAGLISPEAVPFMRNEQQLQVFLDGRKVDYLIAFPEFYPQLVQGKEEVFKTGGEFSARFGYENMAIYRWK